MSRNGILAYGGVGSKAEASRLLWFDRGGKQIGEVGERGGSNVYTAPRLSPDGKKLAVSVGDPARGATDIWVYDLGSGTRIRLTFDPSINSQPIWSPDGSEIVFFSNRLSSFPQMYRKASNGAGKDELLLNSHGQDRPDDWSPDGKYIMYEPNSSVNTLWLLPLFGERKPLVFIGGEAGNFPAQGKFSPDGKWLAHAEYGQGRLELYLTPFPSSAGKWQVSADGGQYPRWRGDGKELFFLAQNDAILMAVDVDLNGSAPRIGIPKKLFDVHPVSSPSNPQASPYDVAEDGQRFLVDSMEHVSPPQPINVVINWEAQLKK